MDGLFSRAVARRMALLGALCCLAIPAPRVRAADPAAAVVPLLPRPRIVPEAAFQDAPFEVSLPEARPGALFRYTLDGSEPAAGRGKPYQGPVRIAATTVFRAAAFEGDRRISAVGTRTFLFPDQVLRQPDSPPGLPSGSEAWNGTPSAYRMDPQVVGDAASRGLMRASLRALPTLSVSCRMEDLFGPKSGIYLHSTRHGERWERACSLEWIETNGSPGFQIDCGLRVQGNYGRIPEKSPKHSFRVLFKEKYGAGKLKHAVFPDSAVRRFDTLVLRADYNNSWTHWQPRDQNRAQRIRDAWLKDTHRDMGWLAPHNRYVHLYLNGLYWGIYDVAERPDASFAAAYLGGSREDYDVLDESGVKNGDTRAFEQLQMSAGGRGTELLARVGRHIDVEAYIDYLLVNYYAGNGDWGENKNWYAIHRRAEGERWRYCIWDGEMILQGLRDDAVNRPGRPPFGLAESLSSDPEFQLLFADRVQRHCFGTGALTPAACIARWRRRAAELDTAILAESARWGYYRRDVPFTRDREWYAEQRRLVDQYFPKRTRALIRQLQTAGLYPTVEAPSVGVAPAAADGAASQVMLRAGEGAEIWYASDGSDPRASGTSVPSPRAQQFKTPIPASAISGLKARARLGGTWSALVEWRP